MNETTQHILDRWQDHGDDLQYLPECGIVHSPNAPIPPDPLNVDDHTPECVSWWTGREWALRCHGHNAQTHEAMLSYRLSSPSLAVSQGASLALADTPRESLPRFLQHDMYEVAQYGADVVAAFNEYCSTMRRLTRRCGHLARKPSVLSRMALYLLTKIR